MNVRKAISSASRMLGTCLLLGGGSLFAVEFSPRFEGTSLPQPPRQDKPWTPPKTELPSTLVTATQALFRLGLADPRGGAYRVIAVGTGSCWSGDGGVVTTHGWVLPARSGQKWRFAVCWNGLVYPIVSVGEPADLKADILALVKEDEAMRARQARERPDWPFSRLQHAWAEARSISHETLLPLKVSLLLRLGEEELARKLWTTWAAGMPPRTNNNDRDLRDPFLLLATDWVWAEFDRAVCAHMRGDDRLALLAARSATAMGDDVEKRAEQRGFDRPLTSRKLAEGEKVPYLTFLEQLPALLADQERRAKQTVKPPPAGGDAAKRIAAGIRDLEEVSARQWGQPGGVSLGDDPRIGALVREGNAAVEPLLHCLETDTRLTRSVQFHRDFFRHRSILTVAEAAYAALTVLLDNSTFGPGSNLRDAEGRKKAAAEMRAYWQKFKAVSPEERWFRILADDNAGAEQWLQAAKNVVQRADIHREVLRQFPGGSVVAPSGKPGEKAPLRGEALRKKKNPSVSDLLRVRMHDLAGRDDPTGDRSLGEAQGLAEALAAWDGSGNVDELAWFTRTLRERLAADNSIVRSHFLAHVSRWCSQRFRLGDRRALAEYAAWIVEVRPEKCEHNMREVLQPLWQYADEPAIARAADKLFAGGSPWVPLLQKRFGFYTHELLTTPLLRLPAFRRAILDGLADHSAGGTITPHEGGSMSLECALGWSTGIGYLPSDPLVPKLNTKVTFRVCDVYAWSLSTVRGMPDCQLYWPQAKRDEAVAACAALLRRYGERLQPSSTATSFGYPRIELAFPALDRLATNEDVEQGRAIFSLAGQGETRQVKLPERPLTARWTTLKAYPIRTQYWNPRTKKGGYELGYDQDGVVWQAEEVRRDGEWRRFYGFVSLHGLERVPAAEIEFPGGERWAPLTGGLDCRLTPRAAKKPFTVGSPLVVAVELRNRGGKEANVPTNWYRKDGSALRPGVRVRLSRATGERDKTTQEPIWTDVPARKIERLKPDGASRTLAPAEAFTAFELELNDLFTISRPGDYRLAVVFTNKDGGVADGESVSEPFTLALPGK